MEKTVKADEFLALPLRLAYEFFTQKGFENEPNNIKQSKRLMG